MAAMGRYSGVAIVLHWSMAVLIVGNVCLAWIWQQGLIADERVRPAIDWHKSIGIVVLGLAILRILWRIGHRPPALPTTLQRWEAALSKVTHVLLYGIMLGLPISGWVMDSAWDGAAGNPINLLGGLARWPRLGFITALPPATREWVHDGFGEIHSYAGILLYVMLAMHVAGALKHQFVDRNVGFGRMWFSGALPYRSTPD